MAADNSPPRSKAARIAAASASVTTNPLAGWEPGRADPLGKLEEIQFERAHENGRLQRWPNSDNEQAPVIAQFAESCRRHPGAPWESVWMSYQALVGGASKCLGTMAPLIADGPYK